MQTTRKRLITWTFAAVWVATILVTLRPLLSYESAPGRIGTVPSTWPATSKLKFSSDQRTLLVFAHPHCPCTRATIGELAEVMAQVQGKVRAYVVFLTPENSGRDWIDTGLEKSAAQIPGVTVIPDFNGAEAKLFGAETSGHALLFDSGGRLLFSGGITASRGHSGGNAGESAVVALIKNRAADQNRTFVFGCSLLDPTNNGKDRKCRN